MTPIERGRIRASRRPGVIAGMWGLKAALALLAALPVAGVVATTGLGDFPDGDALAFAADGTYLVETIRIGGDGIGRALTSSMILLAAFAFAGLLPLAALLVALSHDGRLRLGAWGGRAFEHLPPFVLMAGAALLAQVVVVVPFAIASSAVSKPLAESMNERSATFASAAILCSGLLLATVVGIVHDLARAACVRHRESGWRSIKAGAALFRRRPAAAISGWTVPAVWTVGVVLAAALVTERLSVESSAAWRWIAVAAAHQTAMLALTALRASWLARALEIAGTPPKAYVRSSGLDAD